MGKKRSVEMPYARRNRKYSPERSVQAALDACVTLLSWRHETRQSPTSSWGPEHEALGNRLLDEIVWAHTQAMGKYLGCPFWSYSATASYLENGDVITDVTRSNQDALIHEHAVPRAALCKWLRNCTPERAKIESILACAVGVVVTVAEDSRLVDGELPVEAGPEQRWQRYRDAKIVLIRHEHLPAQVRAELESLQMLTEPPTFP